MTILVPEARRPAVERGLMAAFGTTELDSLRPLSGGLSGAGIYAIRVGGIGYLLRLEGPSDGFRDPVRGYACMTVAARACIAPAVRYACAEDGVAIMDLIPERSLAIDYAGTREDLITELGLTLRALHATPAFPPLVDYLDGMEALIGQFRQSGLFAPEAVAGPLARYAEAAAVYRRLEPMAVSSHNDLNPRNLIYDGARVWFVDWESAFLADRYVDLAALANVFAHDADQEDLLLRVYFGQAPDPARRARLFLARQINHVFYAMILLNGAAAERPQARETRLDGPSLAEIHEGLGADAFDLASWEGRLAYGKARLRAAGEALAGPEFAAALAVLSP